MVFWLLADGVGLGCLVAFYVFFRLILSGFYGGFPATTSKTLIRGSYRVCSGVETCRTSTVNEDLNTNIANLFYTNMRALYLSDYCG